MKQSAQGVFYPFVSWGDAVWPAATTEPSPQLYRYPSHKPSIEEM